MSPRGFRALLYCVMSMVGLWIIAAAALTHHSHVASIGALLAAAGVLLMFTSPEGDES